MIAHSFNAFWIVGMILIQTSVLPMFGFSVGLFDLMIVFVIYLAIHRSVKESVVSIALMGILVDSLSCSPFGLYMTIYAWLFLGIKLILKYLHGGNLILMPVVVVSAILVENLLITVLMVAFDRTSPLHLETIRLIITQICWGVIIGPFLIMGIKKLQLKWENRFIEKVFEHFG